MHDRRILDFVSVQKIFESKIFDRYFECSTGGNKEQSQFRTDPELVGHDNWFWVIPIVDKCIEFTETDIECLLFYDWNYGPNFFSRWTNAPDDLISPKMASNYGYFFMWNLSVVPWLLPTWLPFPSLHFVFSFFFQSDLYFYQPWSFLPLLVVAFDESPEST